MTTQDWKQVEEKLSGAFGSQKFKIDDYIITVQKKQSKNRLVYVVYINGMFSVAWLDNKKEEFAPFRQRFFNEKTARAYSPSHKAKMLKGIPKREHKKWIQVFGLDNTFSYFTPYFSTFGAVKRKFIKNNKSIQLIEQ